MNQKIIRILIFLVLIIFILGIYEPVLKADISDINQSVYHTLFQNKIDELNLKYDINFLSTIDEYNKAINSSHLYPFNSYNLLIDCQKIIFLMNFSDIDKNKIDATINELYDMKSDILNKTKQIEVTTFSSYGWLSIAEQYLSETKVLIDKAQDSYNDNNFSECITYLSKTITLFIKCEDFLEIAHFRNNSSQFNSLNIAYFCKNSAKKWIQLAENTIEYVESFGETKAVKDCKEDLNISKKEYENENYYIALMEAARSKGLAEYLISRPSFTNRENALNICKIYLDVSKVIFSMVYNQTEIDAPEAQLLLEKAILHLNDAKLEDSEGGSMAIASLSLKESYICLEQAKASLSLQYEELTEFPSDYDNFTNEFNEYEIESEGKHLETPSVSFFSLIILIFIILFVIKRRRK
ncbi:MAG: hypothetical protein MUO82_07475 [Candidatus Thermoplasmatota archaeon]|nr:hypothetical protein [Candidatus Thermoplasmatota archaeon]